MIKNLKRSKTACLRNDNDIITDLCNSIENVLKIVATFLNKQMVDTFVNTAKITRFTIASQIIFSLIPATDDKLSPRLTGINYKLFHPSSYEYSKKCVFDVTKLIYLAVFDSAYFS